jgi:hypothetical protein
MATSEDHPEAEERPMTKVGGWLAGIIGSIIVGYAVWFFTKPPDPPATTVFEGMVYSGNAPVTKAMVSVELSGSNQSTGPIHDFTDDSGAYKFNLTGLPKTASAKLLVVANGYLESEPRILAQPLGPDVRLDFPLTPKPADPTTAAASPQPPTATPAPTAGTAPGDVASNPNPSAGATPGAGSATPTAPTGVAAGSPAATPAAGQAPKPAIVAASHILVYRPKAAEKAMKIQIHQ